MQHPLSIPQPCTASWEAMTPSANGRFCGLCNKTVIDFTNWETSDIIAYLQQQGTTTCGRVRKSQLEPEDNEQFVQQLAQAAMPVWRKIAAIFLVAFGLVQVSCNTDTPATAANNKHADSITTVRNNDTSDKMTPAQTSGKVAEPADTIKKHKRKINKQAAEMIEGPTGDEIMGAMPMAPDPGVRPVPANDTAHK